MNQKDRKKINVSCAEIALQIDMTVLWTKLLENRIFNRDDCNIPRWIKNLNNVETKKEIILNIKTRGPHAFNNFLLSLRQTGYDILANNLNQAEINSNGQLEKEVIPKLDKLQIANDSEKNYEEEEEESTDEEKEYEEDNDEAASYDRFIHHFTPLEIVVKKSKKFHDVPGRKRNDMEKYVMRSKPRGIVLIICNIDYIFDSTREGAQHDENNLEKLFKDMGFEVILARNLMTEQIRTVTKEFAAKADFRKVDSCFVIFSCHGNQAGKNWDAEIAGIDHKEEDKPSEIAGIDHQKKDEPYKKLYCSEITELFNSTNCKFLIGKPKVFIFQMCRGKVTQKAVSRYETDVVGTVQPNFEEEEPVHSSNHRVYEDTLIVHATTPGHCSFRDKIIGTWCIQVLCEVFMKEAHHRHLIDLFNIVDKRLEKLRTTTNMCQTLHWTSMGFNNHCFLNPGYFGESQ